jgi:hypothetical protein
MATIIENVAPLAEPAPPLSMDDINHGYHEECSSIMREFARRLAGARNAGERRAIKTARKSALAAAKEKANQAKAARQAANAMRAAPLRPRDRGFHWPGFRPPESRNIL